MAKMTSQRRKTINNIVSILPTIREIGIMPLRRNPRRGRNSQPSQSPPIFGSSNLEALYGAINFNATSQTAAPNKEALADSEVGRDRVSPPLFDDSEPNDLEGAPSSTQEQTKTVEQNAIDVEMTLKTPSPPVEIKGIETQYSDSTTQTEPLELPKVRMVDASTNTEPHGFDASTNTQPHGCDASTNTENSYWPMPEHEQDELSESENSGSGVSYYESSESETDLEDFHSDISSIAEDFIIPKTSASEPDVESVCASPPRTLVFINQQFHSPESAKLFNNYNNAHTSD